MQIGTVVQFSAQKKLLGLKSLCGGGDVLNGNVCQTRVLVSEQTGTDPRIDQLRQAESGLKSSFNLKDKICTLKSTRETHQN